jgi:hypothetical protein
MHTVRTTALFNVVTVQNCITVLCLLSPVYRHNNCLQQSEAHHECFVHLDGKYKVDKYPACIQIFNTLCGTAEKFPCRSQNYSMIVDCICRSQNYSMIVDCIWSPESWHSQKYICPAAVRTIVISECAVWSIGDWYSRKNALLLSEL